MRSKNQWFRSAFGVAFTLALTACSNSPSPTPELQAPLPSVRPRTTDPGAASLESNASLDLPSQLSLALIPGEGGECGKRPDGTQWGKCFAGYCCSAAGYCGNTKAFCGPGCQREFGRCD